MITNGRILPCASEKREAQPPGINGEMSEEGREHVQPSFL